MCPAPHQVSNPFVPIIEEGEEPFAMLKDLWVKYHDWVFEPFYYSSLDRLVGALDAEIIRRAEDRFAELLARKAQEGQAHLGQKRRQSLHGRPVQSIFCRNGLRVLEDFWPASWESALTMTRAAGDPSRIRH
jgi:hypothetical protein